MSTAQPSLMLQGMQSILDSTNIGARATFDTAPEVQRAEQRDLSIREVAVATEQVVRLRIKGDRNTEPPSIRIKKNAESIEPSPASSDEGYETGEQDARSTDRDLLHSRTRATTNPSRFDLTHRLDTCPKTQHFSKRFVVFAHSDDGKEAGQSKARYINLPLIKASISKSKTTLQYNLYTRLQELNSGNSDGLAFAKALFCPKGKLQKEHTSNAKQYLGPWGSELENGAVLVLQLVFIEKTFRRQGLGRLLLQSLIEKAKERTGKSEKGKVKFAVVSPAVVKQDFVNDLEGKTEAEKEVIEREHYNGAIAFYRSMGFRRIRLSKWFGLALDPEHKSHHVAVHDDLDPTEASTIRVDEL